MIADLSCSLVVDVLEEFGKRIHSGSCEGIVLNVRDETRSDGVLEDVARNHEHRLGLAQNSLEPVALPQRLPEGFLDYFKRLLGRTSHVSDRAQGQPAALR